MVPGSYPPILDELGLGHPTGLVSVGGGCIADARIATFSDGSEVFFKCAAGQAEMFAREAEGLRTLAASGAIRIPEVLAVGKDSLVLEMIRPAPRKKGFFADFGQRFSSLHRHRGKACGFHQDNFIGATAQHNVPINGSWEDSLDETGSDWPGFFLQRRLRFQVRLAREKGHGSELERLLDLAENRIIELIGSSLEPPVLLHGDLWGGNFVVDDQGEACLIDPAVYFGHREADLAMTRLFGGFDASFYQAYDEAQPLAAGHEERLPIYQLYHVLNHLNIFGAGYYEHSRQILQKYVD
jgi:fructosamine-3-kinase